jgi:hypothetical protein
MKRYAWGFPLVAVALLTFASSSVSRPAEAANASQNGGAGPSAGVILKQATRGVMVYTAAINSDGTVASCYGCLKAKTLHIGTGQYQVAFGQNVQATLGFSRWVRPDTLAAGATNVWCDTADRAGLTSGVYVNCQTAAGPKDSSFFLFVAK